MDCKDILNLAAIIFIPIVAVLIGQWLQARSERRKDKMQIFKILMTSRMYGWTIDSVHALNLIDVVFVKDKSVRAAWENLLGAYSSTEQSELMKKKRQNLMYKLLEAMAENLGYKDKITWETIQNPYMPQGMVDSLTAQAKSQQTYQMLLNNMSNLTTPQSQNMEEEK